MKTVTVTPANATAFNSRERVRRVLLEHPGARFNQISELAGVNHKVLKGILEKWFQEDKLMVFYHQGKLDLHYFLVSQLDEYREGLLKRLSRFEGNLPLKLMVLVHEAGKERESGVFLLVPSFKLAELRDGKNPLSLLCSTCEPSLNTQKPNHYT